MTVTPVSSRFTALTLIALLHGCGNQEANGQEPPAQTTEVSAEARAAIEPILASYERLRAKLVADDLAGTSELGRTLEGDATRATDRAPAGLHGHLTEVATAARRFATMSSDDPEAVRRQFGEISRPLITMMSAAPSLRGNRQVFRCPMAPGYEKWIQVGDEVSNPYMGTRMPHCGSQSAW